MNVVTSLASCLAGTFARTAQSDRGDCLEIPMTHRIPLLLFFAATSTAATAAATAADTLENARTIDGVRAVEAHWQRAFLAGDGDYLDALLDAQYVSVGHAGNARPKAEIIELSKTIAAKHIKPEPPEHPATIVVRDDAAVVTDSANGDTSVDVFYYADGRWHAWYSQHTPVVPK
jgi:hypothetical protein